MEVRHSVESVLSTCIIGARVCDVRPPNQDTGTDDQKLTFIDKFDCNLCFADEKSGRRFLKAQGRDRTLFSLVRAITTNIGILL